MPVLALMRGGEGGHDRRAAAAGGQIAVSRVVVSENLLGEQETTDGHPRRSMLQPSGQITALTADSEGRTCTPAMTRGRLAAGSWTRRARYRRRRSSRRLRTGARSRRWRWSSATCRWPWATITGEVTTWFTVRVDEQADAHADPHAHRPRGCGARDRPVDAQQDVVEPG